MEFALEGQGGMMCHQQRCDMRLLLAARYHKRMMVVQTEQDVLPDASFCNVCLAFAAMLQWP